MDKQEGCAMAAPLQPTTGLVSIVVYGYDQASSTDCCVRALSQHTQSPWELLIVQGGAAHTGAADIESFAGTQPRRIQVVTSSSNRDLQAAVADAIRVAEGEY